MKSNRSTKHSKEKHMGQEKTKEATSDVEAEVVGTRSALAKVVPIEEARLDLFNPLKWTKEDLEVIKKTVCPAGIPDAEFKLFILKCQASGMNPLLSEAFCVKRRQNIGNKDRPEWVDVFQFTPGEQGMEGRADDFADYRGIRAAAVYEKDKIVIDPSTGEVSHQYNPAGDRGKLLGAWAIAYREGRKTPVEYVRIDEYFDSRNPKWSTSPATMIVKCARAAALRRAYPNKFDGIFVREELRDEADQQAPEQAAQANRDTTDKLADRMKATAAAQSKLKDVPPGQRTVDVVVEKPKETAKTEAPAGSDERREAVLESFANAKPTAEEVKSLTEKLGAAQIIYDVKRLSEDMVYFAECFEKLQQHAKRAAGAVSVNTMDRADKAGPAPVDQGPLMVFGPKKGKPIASLEGPELLENSVLGESKIGSLTPDKAAKVRACIEQIKAEQKKREAALLAEPPEPGSDLDVD